MLAAYVLYSSIIFAGPDTRSEIGSSSQTTMPMHSKVECDHWRALLIPSPTSQSETTSIRVTERKYQTQTERVICAPAYMQP